MASAGIIKIDAHHLPVASVPTLSQESAAELSKLMQVNHERHNVFFNQMGFHNHIAHHLVSLYALGANPAELEHAFSHNAIYQLPRAQEHPSILAELDDPKVFIGALSSRDHYTDFLKYFIAEIEAHGVDKTLEKFIFSGDERAEAMHSRLHAGLIHPFIHLGLAVEFDIPAMVAEALAWTAVHHDEVGDYVRTTEKLAESSTQSPLPSVVDLIEELQASDEIRNGVKAGEFLKGGALFNRGQLAIDAIAAKYRVPIDQVDARMNEAINAMAYLTLAIQRPPYVPKVDFFMVHLLNGSVFLPALSKRLAPAHFARLLEGFVRIALLTYSAMSAPDLHLDYILSFAKDPAKRAKHYAGTEYADWASLFPTANKLDDDGHVAKAVRALLGAEQAAGKQTIYKEAIKKEDILGLAGVLLRSCETLKDFVASKGPTDMWVRGCGFEENWIKMPKL